MLVVAVLAAAGFGAYKLGHHIDSESNRLARQDSELTQRIHVDHGSRGPSRETLVLVVGGMAAGAAVLLLVSLAGTALRARRRQRWHAGAH